MLDSVMAVLPEEVRRSLRKLSAKEQMSLEEIRLRLGVRPSALLPEGEKPLPESVPITGEMLRRFLEMATGASPYAFRESLDRGYISAPSGIRIGLCGEIWEEGEKSAGRTLTSASLRLPREILGCGEFFAAVPFPSTLILSPPGAGKTTLLRDIIRAVSDKGVRVSVCDERGEIAGFTGSSFGFRIGTHTDVITHCRKERAAMMLLRSMNPQVLAMDEITEREDAEACILASNCGVSLLATAHAASEEDYEDKPLYRSLREQKVFQRLIVISCSDGRREYRVKELV